MATISSKQHPRSLKPSKNYRWLLFLSLLILLTFIIILCPVILFKRLETLKERFDYFREQDYITTLRLFTDQVSDLHRKLSEQEYKASGQNQNDLIMLKASVEHNQWEIDQLRTNVEYYKTAYLQTSHEFATYKTETDKTIKRLEAGLNRQNEWIQGIQRTIPLEIANDIRELRIQVNDISQEMTEKHQQAVELQKETMQYIDYIVEEVSQQKKVIQDLQEQHDEVPQSPSVQKLSEFHAKSDKGVKAQEKNKIEASYETMNPFDSSDEESLLELSNRDEEAIVKLLKKASEKMQEGLKKGKKQVEKVMERVKTATKKVGEEVGEVGIKFGGKISSQVHKLVENGRQANDMIKKLIEVSTRGRDGDSDFDESLEL